MRNRVSGCRRRWRCAPVGGAVAALVIAGSAWAAGPDAEGEAAEAQPDARADEMVLGPVLEGGGIERARTWSRLDFPEGGDGDRLQAVLDLINVGMEAYDAAAFAPAYLNGRDPTRATASLRTLGERMGGVEFVRVDLIGRGESLHEIRTGTGLPFRLRITNEVDPPHRIESVSVRPLTRTDAIPVFDGWADADRWIAARLPGRTAHAVVEYDLEGRPHLLHGALTDEVMPITHLIDFFVLAALSDAITEGGVDVSGTLTVEAEDLTFIPSLREELSLGRAAPLREMLVMMHQWDERNVSQSLMRSLGRGLIEAQVQTFAGDGAPTLPVLTVRELVALKVLAPEELRRRYAAAGVDERRALLAGEVAELGYDPAEVRRLGPEWTVPRDVERIGWFGTASGMARLLGELWTRGLDEPVLIETLFASKLSIGSWGGRSWTDRGFRGSSEPGALAGSFLLLRHDSRRFGILLFNVYGGAAVDHAESIEYFAGVTDLLSSLPRARWPKRVAPDPPPEE